MQKNSGNSICTDGAKIYQDTRHMNAADRQDSLETSLKLQRTALYKYDKSIQNLDIKEITGLETCVHLQDLWICESKVAVISGLNCCVDLRRLYLYSNKITKIEGLLVLVKLEQLWINDNEITEIENLGHLKRLTNLQLGNNRIVNISCSLNENCALKELNLSGNRICSFQEILHLTRLQHLTHLCLSDPNYADNPICMLCNYQTHVVYHFPNLKSLDTLEITEESRRIISATVLKKRMYYNMRIRTIQRNTNSLIKNLQGVSAADQERLEKDIELLMARSKKLQKKRDELAAAAMLKLPHDSNMSTKLEAARQQINAAIESKTQTHINLLIHRSDIHSQIMNQSDMAIRKLLLELETGGNVRFEDEQKDDPWVSECENLVKVFIKRAVSKNSPRTIQIHRISRLHNRNMKLQFDDRLMKAGDTDTPLPLCYHGRESSSDDVFSVVEHGCELIPGTTRLAESVVLSNVLDCYDGQTSENNENEPQMSTIVKKSLRQAVIIRGLLKNSANVSNTIESIKQCKVNEYPKMDAVYQKISNLFKNKDTPTKTGDIPKEYCVFSRNVLLPEYFIEYSLESDMDQYTTQLERLLVDIAYSNRMSHSDMPSIAAELRKKLTDLNEPLKVMANDISMSTLEALHPEIMMMDNTKQSETELMDSIVSKSGIALEHLNLSSQCAFKQNALLHQKQLRSLTISHGNLMAIPKFPSLPLLERLDLSFNAIHSLENGFEMYSGLKFLDLAGNNISNLECLKALFCTLCNLAVLDLRFNPVCKHKGYRKYCLTLSSTLQVLDAIPVEKAERHNVDWNTLFESRASSQQHLFRPLSMRTQTGYGSTSIDCKYLLALSRNSHTDIQTDIITTLQLDSCNLFNLDMLPDEMPSLRWASFRNNNLKDVSKLSKYRRLEDISLENNEIHSVDALSKLEYLTKFDASNNLIASVNTAANFKSLMLFSLENNRVKSLKPFSKMVSLMEFYIGNNQISDMFGIFPLKELPRLIILDLTGNAILDGAGITAKEQTHAKEIYMGKLTIELLGEKIGHFTFKNISELDLRNCKIREIDCLANGDFRNLRRLNFDNNMLTNIDCFTTLVGLRCLSLNNNRIERLLSSDTASPVPASSNLGSISSLSGNSLGELNSSAAGCNFGNGLTLRRDSTSDYGKSNPLLSQLEELYLGHNQITRIADLGLHRMPQLRTLYLQGNKIGKIDGLEHMTSLTELVLDKNQIKTADPLSFLSLINLKELHIKENRLRSLMHFDCLPNLQMLFLSNNRIHEMSEIEKMKLPSLLEISLASNAVSRKQLYRIALVIRFPQILGIDGKDVADEERQRAHAYYFEQCMAREDPIAKLATSNTHNLQNSMSSLMTSNSSKHPIKITSVVLDGK
ncbi:hypothetical protein BDEG_24350 [Batrachochytrium dendrobatidis JEL423]|uniref:Protein phosphatase 1 regulatory subunit 7 n=1 Tax=Batrachochytrium dendrobatidis (strain JEL423) TaxID=403673 RepID=A0A177WKL4_BATDL|nr:hypothetical protein BDEG_24350 [Batrachochytrium dendrobatidis JEL423]